MKNKKIKQFILSCKSRLNFHIILKEIIYSSLIILGGMLIISLSFVFQGLKVNLQYLWTPIVIGFFFFFIRFVLLKYNNSSTVKYIDSFFDLKDTVSTSIYIEDIEKQNGFHSSQIKYASEKIATLDIKKIIFNIPKKSIYCSLLLLSLVLYLSSLDDSIKVKLANFNAKETKEISAKINEEIKKEKDDIESEFTEEEKKAFQKSKLSKMIEALKVTENKKEALKQYAKMEREFQKVIDKHSMEKEEKLFAEIANKFMKSQKSYKLGEKLSQKKYNDVAKELSKLMQKNNSNLKNVEALKSLTEKMQDATTNMKESKSGSKKNINNLNKSLSKLMKSMKKGDKEAAKSGKISDKTCSAINKSSKECKSTLSKLSNSLKKCDSKNKFISKLNKLKKSMMKAQQCMLSKNKKGAFASAFEKGTGKRKGVGKGTDNSKNNTFTKAEGQDTQLNGIKGAGESTKSISDATTGSGVASKSISESKNNNYKYRVEAFIERDDVPETMKNGVKKYFTTIHK